MNPEQLQAFFAEHKTAVLGTAAAGVVGLALLQRKKKTTAGGTSQPAGTIPAAAVVPSNALQGSYDSSAYDVYSALQPQIAQLSDQLNRGNSVTAAPAPIASTLFAPSGSGNYVRYGSSIAEVESDGSLFAPTSDQWQKLAAQGAAFTQVSGKDSDLPSYYTTAGNLAKANQKTA